MDIAKHITRQREKAIRELLPDLCQIYPKFGATTTIGGAGILTTAVPEAREWRGSTDIKCRFDISRAFRNDKLKFQTAVVDEYNLELPFDVTVLTSDIIKIGSHRFQVRKMKDISEWDVTIECLITELDADYDHAAP